MEPPPNRQQLQVARSEQDGVQVVELAGELDLNSVGQLDAALAAAAGAERPRVCLDMSRLGFIDSTGLAGVIRAHLAVAEAGGAFAVVSAPGNVRRTLETTGLMNMLSVVDDREAALQDLV
jgi:anti-sigma B factor antagonist